MSEDKIKEQVAQYFIDRGYQVEWGEIDIGKHSNTCTVDRMWTIDVVVVDWIDKPLAIECKTKSSGARLGIGQALSYRKNGYKAAIACDEFCKDTLDVIADLPIGYYYVTDTIRSTRNVVDTDVSGDKDSINTDVLFASLHVLLSANMHLKMRIEKTNSQMMRLNNEIQSIVDRRDSRIQELTTKLNREVGKREDIILELKDEISRLENEESANAELRSENSQLNTELNDALNRVDHLESEIDELNTKYNFDELEKLRTDAMRYDIIKSQLPRYMIDQALNG